MKGSDREGGGGTERERGREGERTTRRTSPAKGVSSLLGTKGRRNSRREMVEDRRTAGGASKRARASWEEERMEERDVQKEHVLLRTSNVKAIAAVMEAVKTSTRQTSILSLTEEGLTVRCEEAAKTMHSTAFVGADVFGTYQVADARVTIGLEHHNLVDALHVFAQSTVGELTIVYPSKDGEMLLELEEVVAGTAVSTYARIRTVVVNPIIDWMTYWEEPSTSFITSGDLLREVVDDLDGASGSVCVTVLKSPAKVTFVAGNASDLSIEIPVTTLLAHHFHQAYTENYYNFRHLKIGLGGLNSSRDTIQDVKSNVKIDKKGLFKVVHMLNLPAAQHLRMHVTQTNNNLAIPGREGLACTLTYFLQPQET